MRRLMIGVAVLALAGPIYAQETAAPSDKEEKDSEKFEKGGISVEPVPGWSIKPEIDNLGKSMKQFNTLIGSLNRANKDLSDEFQKYLRDPKNEVVASSLEKKMAAYAAQVQGEFSAVISEQDALSSNFRMLRRKLQQLSGHLGTKAGDFQEKYKSFADESKKLEKGVIELAVRIKENPPEDPDELRKLKQEFTIKARRYKLKERYVKGYQARLTNYQQLRKNLDKLADLFVLLHEKFNDLMDNLQNEKTYLRESIELQADTLRIKQIIREGIVGGDNAIKNVSEKLSSLYSKVDVFTTVHDRINADLNQFINSQTALLDVSNSLNDVGNIGETFGTGAKNGNSIDKLIEEFANKKDAPLTNADDDILKPKDGTNENK